jgi:hypothetical protein
MLPAPTACGGSGPRPAYGSPVVLRRLRWVASQLGARGSGRLLEPAQVLLRLGDLPDGWRRIDERRWRTGRSGGAEPWAARARELGGVTAWRSFAAARGGRWLWAQATPMAGEADAADALDGIWDHSLRNLRARVEVVASRTGPTLHLPDSSVMTLEQQTRGRGTAGIARHLAWSCRGVVSVLAGSGSGNAWEWQDLEVLASIQTGRIRALIGEADDGGSA